MVKEIVHGIELRVGRMADSLVEHAVEKGVGELQSVGPKVVVYILCDIDIDELSVVGFHTT